MTNPFVQLPGEGDRLGRYELTRKLGAGGMGAVFEGVDREAGLTRAIKVLPGRTDQDLLDRFAREGRAMAQVPRHPHVIQVMHGGETEAGKYLVMEFAPGGDLVRRLAAEPVEPAQAAAWVRDLADGLAHVHAHGVLHRDLKPDNVVFDAEGRIKLTDFGLAAVADTKSLTESGTLLGTPSYMAPEQAHCEETDARTDVYGLGAILFFLLTGRAPFVGGSTLVVLSKVAAGDITWPQELDPTVPAGLDAICRKAMARTPEERYPDAAELRSALEGWLADPDTPSDAGRSGVVAVVAVAVVAVAVVGGILVAGRSGEPSSPATASSPRPTPPPVGASTPSPRPPVAADDRLKRIRAAFASRQKVVESYAELKDLVVERPSDLEAWVLLSRVALGLGARPRARTAANRAIELNAHDPRGFALMARTFLAENRPKEAQQALIPTRGSSHPWCRGVRWILAVHTGRQGSKEGEALVQELPRVGFIAIALGDLFWRNGVAAGALQYLEQGLKHEPNDVPGLLIRAEVLIAHERMREAYQDVQHVRKLRGDLPDAMFLEALLQARGNNPRAALESADRLRRVLQRSGRKSSRNWVDYLRGAARYGMNQYPKALVHLQYAVDRSPNNHRARYDLCRTYLRLHRPREAMVQAEFLVKKNRPEGHLLAAWAFEESGQTDRARMALRQYTARNGPTILDELWLRWRLGRRAKDPKETRAAMNRLKARRPQGVDVLWADVVVCADEGDWAAAAEAAERLRNTWPESKLIPQADRIVRERRPWPR